MAVQPNQIKERYPLPASNFRVHILEDQSPQPPEVKLISCTQVLGLAMEIESTTYRHGMSFMTGFNLIPAIPIEVRFSLLRGIVRQRRYFTEWMQRSYPQAVADERGHDRKRDIIINLCDEQGEPAIRWTVLKAMPLKLHGPSFEADTNQVAFERLDLVGHELKIDYNP